MDEDEESSELVDISFMDFQGLGNVPEPVGQMVNLVTKAAMGFFLAYYSVNELYFELKKYRENLKRETGNNENR